MLTTTRATFERGCLLTMLAKESYIGRHMALTRLLSRWASWVPSSSLVSSSPSCSSGMASGSSSTLMSLPPSSSSSSSSSSSEEVPGICSCIFFNKLQDC